jgi:hypothetical protein
VAEAKQTIDYLACESGELNGNITFTFTPQEANRWHRLYVAYINPQNRVMIIDDRKLGKASDTTPVTRSYTVPINFREEIYESYPTKKMVQLEFWVTAYTNSNYTSVAADGAMKPLFVNFPPSEVGPEAELWVAPVSDLSAPLSSLYIPGKTKVIGEMPKSTWKGKYKTEVLTATITVGTQSGEAPFTSDYITGANAFYVKGTVTDARGISTTYQQLINPTVASIPQLLPVEGNSSVIVARWKEDKENPNGGAIASDGDQMYIAVRRNFSPLIVNGEQGNFCSISFKAKAMGENTESEWITLLDEQAENNEIETVITDINGRSFDATKTFTIQLRAIDRLGNENISTFKLPTEAVYMCRAPKKNSIAFGGYVSQDNSFEVYQEAIIHGGFVLKSESGDSYFRITVDENGVLSASPVSEAQTFLLRRGNK